MKRMLALTLALIMIMALVACGGSKTPTTSGGSSSAGTSTTTPSGGSSTTTPSGGGSTTTPTTPTEPAKPAEPKVWKDYTKNEGFTLNVHASGSTYDGTMLDRILMGLYGYLPVDGKSVLSPILADGRPVDVNGDGKTWNIKISKDAKWQNGDPINADTFMYSWKEGMDPVMYYTNGKGLATGRITIVNAVEYYNQKQEGAKAVAWEDVGIKKIDDYTIQLQLTAAVNDMAVMTWASGKAMKPVYEPLYAKCKSADGLSNTYGSNLDTFMGNGPYNLVTWTYEALHEYEKNPNYILADLVKIDKVIEPIIKDDNTLNQMFENGEIFSVSLNSTNKDKYEEDPRLVVYPSRTTNTLEVNTANTSNPILANYNFRMAMYWGFDRAGSCKLYNYEPHLSTIPHTAGGMEDGTLYYQVAQANNIYLGQETMGYDPVLAKQYFDKALAETGLSHVTVSFLVTEGYSKCAVFLQEEWPKIFGADKITVNVDIQTTGVINERRGSYATKPTTEGSYDIAFLGLASSASDYNPASGSSYYNSNRAARNAPHENEKAAELYRQATSTEAKNNPELGYQLAMEYEKALQETMTAIPWSYAISKVIRNDCLVLPIEAENYEVNGGWCSNYADIIQ